MLADLIDGFSRLYVAISGFGRPAIKPTEAFDWSVIIPTFVGGGATILAAILAFWLSYRTERKRREADELKVSSTNALAGYFKLAQWANLLGNINAHIDKHYEQARENGHVPEEACLIVGPSVGIFSEPERLTSDEYRFLLTDHYRMIDDIFIIEQRAINTHHLFKKYSELHLEMQAWLETLPGFERQLDGPLAKDKVPNDFYPKFEVRAAQLNRILAGVLQNLEEDIAFATRTTQEFADIGFKRYSPAFPKIAIQAPANKA